MNTNMHKIEETLMRNKPTLSQKERDEFWVRIEASLPAQQRIPSPYAKWMAGTLAVALFGGGVATVFASEVALPGDSLFPVALAVEHAQIAFSSKSKQEELRKKFAQERLLQVGRVIARSSNNSGVTVVSSSTLLTSDVGTSTTATVSSHRHSDDVDRAVDVAINTLEDSLKDSDDEDTQKEIRTVIERVSELHQRGRHHGDDDDRDEGMPANTIEIGTTTSVDFVQRSSAKHWWGGHQGKTVEVENGHRSVNEDDATEHEESAQLPMVIFSSTSSSIQNISLHDREDHKSDSRDEEVNKSRHGSRGRSQDD